MIISSSSNKNADHKTAYGRKNDQLVHISDVASGLGCGCSCVVCGGELIAKKGRIRVHHFAHAAETNCTGAAETALHALAKELVCNLSSIHLPQYIFKKEKRLKSGIRIKYEEIILEGGRAPISKAVSEQAEDGFIPDVTLKCKSKTLFVEIAVTHKVDRAKLRLIRKSGVPTIEINLDIEDATLTREELALKLQNPSLSKCWLFHPNQKNAERRYFDKVRGEMRKSKTFLAFPQTYPPGAQRYQNRPIYENKAGEWSIVKLDRMIYEFNLKFGRQPTYQEEQDMQASLLRGSWSSYSSSEKYALLKGKRSG